MLTVKTPERLHQRVLEWEEGAPLIVLRNIALSAVAYDTLLRRSEFVSLEIRDLERGADGSGTVLETMNSPFSPLGGADRACRVQSAAKH